MRSALATSAERRAVCDSFVGKTTEVFDLHVAHHPRGALPKPPNDILCNEAFSSASHAPLQYVNLESNIVTI